MNQSRTFSTWPAAPGNAATIVLFSTQRLASKGGLEIAAVEFTWHRNDQASAANGLRCYALDDTNTWRETDLKDDFNLPTIGSAAPLTIPALATGQEWREKFVVAHLRGFSFEYTAGAVGPSAWNGSIAIHRSALAVQR